ncbi:hypothetical protein NE237_022233 [Protea cynaroides]|uniref:Uncharacterized protein n=1 Tax=Protea cynaroides TaxID=273540 RepID=A0A9Q0HAM9_9MAGN|nr:hypothetical protein NE237_022233 [Protea cynaroides]
MEFLSGRGKDLFLVGVAVFGRQNATECGTMVSGTMVHHYCMHGHRDLRPGSIVDRRLQREGNQGDHLHRGSVVAVCKSGAMAKSVKISPNKEGFIDMGRSLGFPSADPMNLVKQLAPHVGATGMGMGREAMTRSTGSVVMQADSIHGVMLLDHNLFAEGRILLDVSSSGFISQRQHGANQRMISHVQGSGPRVIGEQM